MCISLCSRICPYYCFFLRSYFSWPFFGIKLQDQISESWFQSQNYSKFAMRLLESPFTFFALVKKRKLVFQSNCVKLYTLALHDSRNSSKMAGLIMEIIIKEVEKTLASKTRYLEHVNNLFYALMVINTKSDYRKNYNFNHHYLWQISLYRLL